MWLLGGAVTALGGVLNALALHYGTLAGVMALTTLSLVIALPFGVLLTDQRLTGAVWVGACTAGGRDRPVHGRRLPGAGHRGAECADWWSAGLVCVALAGILVRLGHGRPPLCRR